MIRHRRTDPSRPARAIAMPANAPVAHGLLWVLAAILALGMFGAVREAVGSADRVHAASGPSAGAAHRLTPDTADRDALAAAGHADAVALLASDRDATRRMRGAFSETHAIPHRATLRAADRMRRAAGRAGLSARRDTGGPSAEAVVTADAALLHPAGAAPNDAEIACSPTHRGLHACGVRGPPGGIARLG